MKNNELFMEKSYRVVVTKGNAFNATKKALELK